MIVTTGLGDATANEIKAVNIVGGAGATVATGAAGAAFASVGAGATAFGMTAAVAVPVIGAAIAGVTLLVNIWLSSIAKHNQEKTAATKIVNDAEPLLVQNRDAYLSNSTHTQIDKDQALYNANAIIAQVKQACANTSLEDAGKRCISERFSGSSSRWDWYALYVTPIENTSTVSLLSDVGSQAEALIGGFGINPTYMLWGAFGLLAIVMLKGKS